MFRRFRGEIKFTATGRSPFVFPCRPQSTLEKGANQSRKFFRNLNFGFAEFAFGAPLLTGVLYYLVFHCSDWMDPMIKESNYGPLTRNTRTKPIDDSEGGTEVEVKYRLNPIYHDGKLIAYQREIITDEGEERRLKEEKEKQEYYG